MKVLIIQPWISFRGSETVSLLEAYYLKKAEVKSSIACLYADWDRISDRFKTIDFILPPKSLQRMFQSSRLFLLLFGFPVLLLLILKNAKGFDVLNPHNLPSHWICTLIKPIVKKKIVWTVHGVPKKAYKDSFLLEKLLWLVATGPLDNWAIKKIDRIISVSNKVAGDVKARYGRQSEILCPVINVDEYAGEKKSGIKKRLGFEESDSLLLHVSYLHPAKNVEISIQVLKKISPEITNAKLLIVGCGPQKLKLESLVEKLDLKKRVYFYGHVNPSMLKNYYAVADIILVPYWKTEGCSLVVFEALLANKISIIAKNNGADELIAKNKIGIVAKPNFEDFSSKVISFYQNRSIWVKTAKRGKKFVIENMSGEVYVKKFLSLITSI